MNGKYQTQPSRKSYHVILVLLLIILAVCIACLWLLRPAPESGDTPTQPKEPEADISPTESKDPTPPPTEEPTAPPDPVLEQAQQILDSMTLEEKIYQLFIVTPEQITGVGTVIRSGETTRKAIETYPVGGIVYFAANLIDREQTITMISNIQSYSKLGLFISVDEEGGLVARVARNKEMGTTAFPAMGKIGKSGDTGEAYQVGYTIGSDIAALGFNLDFAPVADVNSNPRNPIIGTRAFHSDPEIAAQMVEACVKGFGESGVLCTLKHFPGHGDTSTDSHYGEAETSKTLVELMECEMLPFISGIEAGAPFVMVGHITAPNVTDEPVPATLSHDIVTGLLRGELGFEGLIITDSMLMQAITDQYSAGDAAVKALQAGVDIILMPQNLTEAVTGIQDAITSGELTEARINESVLRILETKIRSGIIASE